MAKTFLHSDGDIKAVMRVLLASEAFRDRLDWRAVELYFGDERCVPPDDERSNYRMAKESLIDRVPIPPDNVYRMKGEIDPEAAAKEYGQLLKERFLDEGPDVLLLGMGDDGHTASLFPGTAALGEEKHRCVANYVPNAGIPAGTNWRITLTFPFINRSREVFIMVTGAAKAERLEQVLIPGDDSAADAAFPIRRVAPTAGTVTWFLDVAAAGM
jgi:6-phosphogluconolactonase